MHILNLTLVGCGKIPTSALANLQSFYYSIVDVDVDGDGDGMQIFIFLYLRIMSFSSGL